MEDEVGIESPSLTEQLRVFSSGDRMIDEEVLRRVLPELHRIAVRELGREYRIAPLSATELIHEVWLKNLRKGGWEIENRQHFYSFAALAMRHVLIDFARTRTAQRRGNGNFPVSLDTNDLTPSAETSDLENLVEIGILMDRLERRDPQTARIVDLHYFTGFTLEEIAEITGLTFRQVRHRWESGRDWLKDGLLG
jgi:RNA polymerase sigma factor (TIGR02999 family)